MEKTKIIENLTWRYATKKFDNTKKLSKEQTSILKQIISLTPSSYGLEPYKALLITDSKIREELKKVSWNQSQVTDCSHYVVFLYKTIITEKDVENYIERVAKTRNMDKSNLTGYKDMMIGDLVKGPRSKYIKEWAKNQSYIALGNTMTALSTLSIDACPLEGFDPESYNKILKLEKEGFYPSVALAVGFRAKDDSYANLKKVRTPEKELIKEL